MASGVSVRVLRTFRWRKAVHRYDEKLWMPARTARRLLSVHAVQIDSDLPIRRYRCRLARPVDHSTEQERGVANV